MKNYLIKTKYLIKQKFTQKNVELNMESSVNKINNCNSQIIRINTCHSNKILVKLMSKCVNIIKISFSFEILFSKLVKFKIKLFLFI